ncbi:MAG TPA: DUF2169 domain-containing protein [Rhodothermales bacterium]|nr:DUF2169 domain-containing protein [Rhodothermales bacterium]
MDLVNTTPLPASLKAGPIPGQDRLMAALVAKATFRIGPGGAAELETQEPVPLFDSDTPSELGLIPRDDLVRRDAAFEVVVLGAAYAAAGRPATAVTVSLTVGAVRRDLLVIGDRRWEGLPGRYQMSAPAPFTRMPMGWERAFGGTAEVLIDLESVVTLSDARNPAGRGYDGEKAARQLGESLPMPQGYPVLVNAAALRRLPNLEDPRARIIRFGDAPDPAGWSALPLDSAFHVTRALEGLDPATLTSEQLVDHDPLLYRAHPQWVIALPPRGATITLENATPGGRLATALPALRVVFDYVNDGRTATRDLVPQMLVLYPEEGRMTVTYRKPFTLPVTPGTERGVRLRTEAGWFTPPTEQGR